MPIGVLDAGGGVVPPVTPDFVPQHTVSLRARMQRRANNVGRRRPMRRKAFDWIMEGFNTVSCWLEAVHSER